MSVCENVSEFVSQATLRLGVDAVQQEGVSHKHTHLQAHTLTPSLSHILGTLSVLYSLTYSLSHTNKCIHTHKHFHTHTHTHALSLIDTHTHTYLYTHATIRTP